MEELTGEFTDDEGESINPLPQSSYEPPPQDEKTVDNSVLQSLAQNEENKESAEKKIPKKRKYTKKLSKIENNGKMVKGNTKKSSKKENDDKVLKVKPTTKSGRLIREPF